MAASAWICFMRAVLSSSEELGAEEELEPPPKKEDMMGRCGGDVGED